MVTPFKREKSGALSSKKSMAALFLYPQLIGMEGAKTPAEIEAASSTRKIKKLRTNFNFYWTA
ncbi:hypothetical protein A4244_08150 [Bacillus badius]|nr:hypothetical protein A4244_08150 [Bacillus badius]OCS83992.1 hypothetical protein A6M11_08165 [Bacillus badius]OVE52714.1 hypothetical protein B1A98_03695 [Bacillus badius]